MERLLLAFSIAVILPLHGKARADNTEADRIARLVSLARVAEAAFHFHPALDSDVIRWNEIEAVAIRRVSEARDDTQAARAVGEMLATLDDPISRVELSGEGSPLSTRPADTGIPAARYRFYTGWPPERGQMSGGYAAMWRIDERLLVRSFALPGGATAFVRTAETATAGAEAEAPLLLGQRRIDWSEEEYPAQEWRVLAAFRAWSVIDLFFAYRDLADDWDSALVEAVPDVEGSADAAEYGLALYRMLARTRDSHVRLASPAVWAWFGVATVPVPVRIIEGRPVVTDIADTDLRQSGALRPGDMIVSVDGVPAADLLERHRGVVPASTEQAFLRDAALDLLAGPDSTTVRVMVENEDGRRKVLLTRSASAWRSFREQRRGPVWRWLDGEIGYVDLDRLEIGDVGTIFDTFRDAKGIVFDGRGYPRGTAWAIAPLLSRETQVVAARFRRRVAGGPSADDRGYIEFEQRIPPWDGPRWEGRTVMLIDERTQSQGEHTGLFLEAANGTVFVGSPTAGANGDVTDFSLPGGIRVTFTGHDVRHADGRPLQRVGLRPDVEARPTIAGIRLGHDEVLEAAVRFLRLKFYTPPRKTK